MNSYLSAYESSKKFNDVYIIIGAQGSGTKLTCQLLNQVFSFSVIRDRSLIFNSAVNLLKSPRLSTINKEQKKVFNALFPPSQLRKMSDLKYYHRQNANYLGIENYFDKISIKTPEEFAYFFYSYHTHIDGLQRFAVKSDDMWENIQYLPDVFPRRKIIFLIRDFRDNVLSILNKRFGPRDIYVGAHYIKQRIRAYHQAALVNAENSIWVKYEQLLDNPKSFITEFAEKFNIEPVRELDAQLEALSIRSTNQNKWRQLSAEHLQICESVLKDELDQFDYKVQSTSTCKFSPNKIVKHRLKDFTLRVPQRLSTVKRNILMTS